MSPLQVVATILESTTRLVANKAAWADPLKREKIEDLALLLQARAVHAVHAVLCCACYAVLCGVVPACVVCFGAAQSVVGGGENFLRGLALPLQPRLGCSPLYRWVGASSSASPRRCKN